MSVFLILGVEMMIMVAIFSAVESASEVQISINLQLNAIKSKCLKSM